MIPDTIRFTELDIEARELLRHPFAHGKKFLGPWPKGWTRHQFKVNCYDDPMERFDHWMADNIQGQWGSYRVTKYPGEQIICVGFELLNEAIMFRLKEGESAWRDDEFDL